MANWDFVFSYDARWEQWLAEQGYPHPPVLPCNRIPTTGDMKWALAAQGNLVLDYPAGKDRFYVYEQGAEGWTLCIDRFDWSDDNVTPDDFFKIRYWCELYFALLVTLCQRCGQLITYPDTGFTGIILDASCDPKAITLLYEEADKNDYDWERFFHKLYS